MGALLRPVTPRLLNPAAACPEAPVEALVYVLSEALSMAALMP